ncbi:hypothetical protein [Cryobacterium sp. Hh11]|nr:hypothetical protein [Cryobacterium sp. Hh11]
MTYQRPTNGPTWPTRKRKANERARIRKIRSRFTVTKRDAKP